MVSTAPGIMPSVQMSKINSEKQKMCSLVLECTAVGSVHVGSRGGGVKAYMAEQDHNTPVSSDVAFLMDKAVSVVSGDPLFDILHPVR